MHIIESKETTQFKLQFKRPLEMQLMEEHQQKIQWKQEEHRQKMQLRQQESDMKIEVIRAETDFWNASLQNLRVKKVR